MRAEPVLESRGGVLIGFNAGAAVLVDGEKRAVTEGPVRPWRRLVEGNCRPNRIIKIRGRAVASTLNYIVRVSEINAHSTAQIV